MSIDQRIRDGLHSTNDQLPAPDIDRALAAVTAGGRPTRRRNLMVALAAAAAAVLVVVGALAVTRSNDNTAPPVGPSPSPTPSLTQTTAPTNPMVNGRVQSTDEYLGRMGAACDGCYWPGSMFDQDTGTLLLIDSEPDNGPGIGGIRVIGRDGLVARLACPEDFACPDSYPISLGPGADEFSVLARQDEVQVLAFDGTVRRRIDLSTALDDDDNAYVAALAWSPEGARLAVQTGGSGHARIWLFDGDRGEPQLVYTASSTESFPRLAIAGTSWSPDGSRLGFVEEHWNMAAEFGRPRSEISESTKAVSLFVPDAEEGGPGVARTLYEYTKDRHPQYNDDAPSVFLWSPDGARVAVRVYDQFFELSAEDGTVLAEHRFIEGDLIWPARQP